MQLTAPSETRPPAVELTDDPAFSRRVIRLARTSVVALGYILLLWAVTLETSMVIGAALAAGWVLMPTVLWSSLHRPRLRYALVLPSSLVSLALLAICLTALPENTFARIGWISMTAGIFLGGVLGIWFWFRLIPVPMSLDHPFAPGRWILVAIHVLMILVGLLLITLVAALTS
jgi:hypothetical protein